VNSSILKKNSKTTLLGVVFLFCWNLSYATTIKGVVRDEQGLPLFHVAVFVPGTNLGTHTNENGEYQLNLKPGKYDLNFNFIGYETVIKPLQIVQEKLLLLDVVLIINTNEMPMLVVNADRRDFVKRLIRGASDKREFYANQLVNYSVGYYGRTSMEKIDFKRDSSYNVIQPPVIENEIYHVNEGAGTLYASNNQIKLKVDAFRDFSPKGTENYASVSVNFEYGEETIVNDRDRWEDPYELTSASCYSEFNLKENALTLPQLTDKKIISPISSTALLSYTFDLVGIDTLNGEKFYKLSLMPIFKQEALFNGYIWIQDTTFVVGKLELNLADEVMPFFSDFSWKEEFVEIEKEKWLSSGKSIQGKVKEGKTQRICHVEYKFKEYEFNISTPLNMQTSEVLKYDDSAFDRDSAYWESRQLIPLSALELKYKNECDSIQKRFDDPKIQAETDSAYNKITFWDVTLSGVAWRNRAKGTAYYINPLIAQANVFGIGGYRHKFGGSFSKYIKENDFYIETDGYIDYGFANKDIRGKGGIGLTYYPKKFVRTYIRFGDYYDMINTFSSFSSVFSRSNYVRAKMYSIEQRMEVVNGLYASLTYEFCDQMPINNLVQDAWSSQLFGDLNKPVEFQRYTKSEFNLNLQWRPGQTYYFKKNRKVVTGFKYPEFKFNYRKGVPGMFGSEVNFDYVELKIHDDYQLPRFGTGEWTLHGGAFVNKANLRLLEYKYFRGSDLFFFSDPNVSFQLLDQVFLTPNAYYRGNYTHSFNGMFFNKIPLLNRLKLNELAGSAFIAIPSENYIHQEIFVGIQKQIRIKEQLFRLGVFAVTSDSNIDKANYTLKFGISFWNTYTKKWSY
jgi:hypothetical protein